MHFLNQAYLLIGGNVGNRMNYLQQAVKRLHDTAGVIVRISSVYETAPWGNTQQPSFLNQAVHLQTTVAAEALMQVMLVIEKDLGRERFERYGPRTIDIDMLLFNQDVHQSQLLTVPHQELQNRRFALLPLAEIAGELMHPLLHKTIRELLDECPDELDVVKFKV